MYDEADISYLLEKMYLGVCCEADKQWTMRSWMNEEALMVGALISFYRRGLYAIYIRPPAQGMANSSRERLI